GGHARTPAAAPQTGRAGQGRRLQRRWGRRQRHRRGLRRQGLRHGQDRRAIDFDDPGRLEGANMRKCLLLLLLLFTFRAAAAPPWYDDRANLLFYVDDKGERRPIRTAQDWQVRAGHVRANMELVMGELPAKSAEPLAIEVKSETSLRHYLRRHIWFSAEKGDRVPAY